MKTITTYAEATSYIESLKALHSKLQDVLGSIGTQLQVSEEEMKKAKKVAWHLKKAEEVMASEPKLETEGKEG